MKKQWGTYGLLMGLLLAILCTGCARAPKQKVFVLGIDGFTFDLLLPWAQEGKLPHFAQLLEEGSSTQLISTIPPISPPAWTSAVTGVNPGKHGVYGFVKDLRPSSDGRPKPIYYTSLDRKADPLWIILSDRGRRSVIINIPSTSPPDKLKGVMISGFPHTSLTNFTYPPEYRFKIPEYRKDSYGREVRVGEEQAFLDDLNDIMERRARVALRLLDEEPWDFYFMVFIITDWVQHFYWKYMDRQHPLWEPEKAQQLGDAILKTYQRMDRFLGQLREKLDDKTTLLIMSDHGFGPIYQGINGQNFLDTMLPPSEFRVMAAETWGADFYLTTAQKPPYSQRTQENYNLTKELLKAKLEELRDPSTGQKIIQKVYQRDDIYWGPYAYQSPDILSLETSGYLFWNWNPTEDGELIFLKRGTKSYKHFFSGYHRMNGVLIMAGANINKGVTNFDAQVIDIAPTVLYLMGEPVPQEMDGRVLVEPITEEYVNAHSVEARWARSSRSRQLDELPDSVEAANKLIEEQLRAIGYVQ